MSSTSRSLVLGAHTALPAHLIEPFARSLRTTGFNGTFVVFAGRCAPEETARLQGLADLVVDVDDDYLDAVSFERGVLEFARATRGFGRIYPQLFAALVRCSRERDSQRRWASFEYHLEGLQTLRYLHYLRFMSSRRPAPDFVMLTDLRDVVFQRDPFEAPPTGLELYLEDDAVRIGHDAFNTRWIRALYGPAGLRRLEGRPVSCSGTVVGTTAGVLAYLGAMVSEIVWRRRPMGSLDQGVHNALLHAGRLPFAEVVPNGDGRVLTMGRMTSYRTDAGGTVLNNDESVPAVLHQWDRHSALVASFVRSRADAWRASATA